MTEITEDYPASLSIDYSEKSNRLTTFFRIFMIIPIFIILSFLSGQTGYASEPTENLIIFGTGFIFIPTLLMILFRKKYPKWWFDWNFSLTMFSTRVFSYLMLLTDQYPSTDEEQAVHIKIRYPDASKELKRGMPLIKWFLAIPHLFILCFLYIGVIIVTMIAWFSILITGKYPQSLFEYVVGVMRWSLRVSVYTFLLTTDKYPLFSLK
jgi:hypothetical protein